ncbi:Pyruvate/ketoisovalerate oxidoreductase, catalytic domain protein [Caldicellulosiruptor owensensis OL]|uniref:Pyruvate/ketoisovalerate oxidoreductase, catalytic domain protein n=1 Tax=Caldicellulosiruptor owensensis (strain ATCC 700167 / DSM 13100 / OL) TaxID=632518 RepID=E4Q5Z0_CALOW|nr:indolepyruvate oxidoreductase subunit beta [Caldicellulosiruptor owensensis]ADQ04364.1 Pyruvate/ketoisovalerate oxidoreductase, catalytic domain protein [Caldicellulosiruptor owensensis OL]
MTDIIIAGVGGQGNILLSRVICQLYTNKGFDVKSAENIGMSQRGGSVVSYIRTGENVGPIIPDNMADILIGLEMCEAARNVNKINKDSIVVLNDRFIRFNSLDFKKNQIVKFFELNFPKLRIVSAYDIAVKLDMPKAENIVMLALVCKDGFLPFSKEEILKALEQVLRPKMYEMNKILVENIYEKY